MAYLEIDGTQYEAKTTFKFEKKANAKYTTKEGENELGGFMNIYISLLQGQTNETLIHFWDCALAHYKDNQPSVEKIEDALDERVEKEGDTEPLFSEAFKVLDESGFFKKQVKSVKSGLLTDQKPSKNETEKQAEERKQSEEVTKELKKRYKELTGRDLKK